MYVEDSLETTSDEVNVVLVSREGDEFPASIAVVSMSEVVRSMLEANDNTDAIPRIFLATVKSEVIRKIILFCEHYSIDPMREIPKALNATDMADVVQKWYADFVDLEPVAHFELIWAASDMGIEPLLELLTVAVAVKMKGRTPHDIREQHCSIDDFDKRQSTPERSSAPVIIPPESPRALVPEDYRVVKSLCDPQCCNFSERPWLDWF